MITRILALVLLAGAALADEPKAPTPPPPEDPHVAAFGQSDRTCLEWTNACQVCIRKSPEDETHCSTPGIACVAGQPVCRRR